MTGSRNPSPDFDRAQLDLCKVAAGTRYERITHVRFRDPLGYGKGPSRFSDPRRITDAHRFGVVYLGSTVKVCMVETLIRDIRDGLVGPFPMSEKELGRRRCSTISFTSDTQLLDLRGDGPVRMGIPSDVLRSSRQALARQWSAAFYRHPVNVAGIIYPSRLNDQTNVALYDRAIASIRLDGTRPLMAAPGFATALNDLNVALVR